MMPSSRAERAARSRGIPAFVFLFLTFAANLPAQIASAWPAADRLFHSDPRWLGSDAAFSIDLGNNRVLWLFGDTWIAHPGSHSRRSAAFIHNTVAIEHGYDPSEAAINFFWRTQHNEPSEILPSEGDAWIWPHSGIRIGNSLIVFGERVAPDRTKNSLGFRGVGWNAYLISNPDADPSSWHPRKIAERRDDIILASAVLQQGNFVYLFGPGDPHNLYLARITPQNLLAGNLSSLVWWTGSNWSRATSSRKPILRDVDTETSIQRDALGRFVEINSQGFGASDIVMRTAPALTGPWSASRIIYRPPESDQHDPFVYAAKSHAELRGADLVLTYATNGFTDHVMDDMSRYFPRFVRVTLFARR
ncbi:MAG TPA: DUF4185 domain-containing protein [Acidobacteriaceae bacterium]|nr:DUF4185 domain-containing protein [Acidobacteriaceae bacterium]